MTAGVKLGLAITLAIVGAGLTSSAISQSLPKQSEVPEEQRVDINHATLEQLLKVPGMTKSWAGRIVRFRPYRSKQELLDRGIVSGEVYNRIKDYIIAHREKQ
jgi:DNA uptake protein ComE-like DNA-binding protein